MKITYEVEDVLQIIMLSAAASLGIPREQLTAAYSPLSYEKSIVVEVKSPIEREEE
jgi:hypothetical protein